jgi:GT2 family glycosyltransferase
MKLDSPILGDCAETQTRSPLAFLSIIALHECTLSNSMTFQTLTAAACCANLNSRLIAIYDNSLIRQVSAAEEANVFAYKHDPANGGVASAYNWALDIARSHGISWLLLLDQDTTLPIQFLESSFKQLKNYAWNPSVVALVPVVSACGSVVSPMRVKFGCLSQLSDSGQGIQSAEIMAINSGSIVRCSFMHSIGGFNRAYWLDYLDHWLCHQIYRRGKKIAVSSCQLDHKLSVRDYRHSVSIERYQNIIAGEAAFFTTYKSRFEIPGYLFRLLFRSIKMLVYRQPNMSLLTIRMLVRIAMHPTRSLEDTAQ